MLRLILLWLCRLNIQRASILVSLLVLVWTENIHITLLIPMTGSSPRGRRTAGAAALAVKQVNADKSLLPGRIVHYSWADSGCSARQGLMAMGKLLRSPVWIDALIGPGCSSACEATSYLSSGQSIPQISHSCTSPALSDKDVFPLVCCDRAVVSLSCCN